MPRPSRQNTNPSAPRGERAKSHLQQETAHERRARLQAEANERNEAWASLSFAEQLEALSRRPGESNRQRARILARMVEAEQASTNEAVVAERKAKQPRKRRNRKPRK